MSSSTSTTKPLSSLSKIKKDFRERNDFEHYFWREEMLSKILTNLSKFYHQECIYQESYLNEDEEEWLRGVPKFRYYTLTIPGNVEKENFQITIIDPPYIYYSNIESNIQWLYKGVCKIVANNFQAKICISFSTKYENVTMKWFGVFGLKPTNFFLDYNQNYFKPNKWERFCLYSNINLPGIKQINK